MEQKDINYLYSLKKYILIMTCLFLLSILIGLLISAYNPGIAEGYLVMFEQSFSWIKTLNPLAIMVIIFLNNAVKSLLALVLGVGLGFIPILFVAGNGIILGMLASIVSKEHGPLFVIAALLPHGIIEVPMVLISAGIGLRLGHALYLSLSRGETDLKTELRQGILFYLRWIAPLLFLAAVVESFITPFIAYPFIGN